MTTAVTTAPLLEAHGAAHPSPLRGVGTFIQRKPLGAIGAAFVLAMVLVALFAPLIAPANPLEFHTSATFQSPSRQYLLGTDDEGRDIWSRIAYGARISLRVGGVAVGFGVTFGLIVGLVSGYMGGKLDFFAQRVVDSFQAFPALLLALAVTTAFDRTVFNVGLALALVTWPTASRVIRAAVLAQKGAMYVEAARGVGARTPRILVRHILPNVASIYIILATAGLAQAILVESSLSFLGVGVRPPEPSWGAMLLEAQRWAVHAPWMAIFPGIAISIAVFGFNLFGDALRDHLDPRLRGR
ncbi:MAG TPA: ABC transporter permease [Dehalococcoidia bacterium]|nr:ABC transporter permease [Dehalococcoidia bacterium]